MSEGRNHSAVYTVDQIRRAEAPLLDAQSRPDELMRSAGSAVAAAARMMLQRPPAIPSQERILLAVGAGGNGGDALYAGCDLLADHWPVEAILLGRDQSTGEPRVHQRALAAFVDAGGEVVAAESLWGSTPPRHRLLIDGLLGMGGSGGVGPEAAVVLGYPESRLIPLLSIDVPSGIPADTGATPGPVEVTNPVTGWWERVPSHAVADVTVTFGGLRRAHAVNAHCGQVLVADPGLDAGGTIGEELARLFPRSGMGPGLEIKTVVAAVPPPDARRRYGGLDHTDPYDPSGTELLPVRRGCGPAGLVNGPREPGPYEDKYSGGVVGVCAGSERYPGAAVLATSGAVRATSAMVRYIGSGAPDVLRVCPEVVWAPTVAEAGRVQAWVVGPGRGTGAEAAVELAELLARPEPLLIDADALTLVAAHPELRAALIARSPDPRGREPQDAETLLTPHAGEFRRLAEAVNNTHHNTEDGGSGASPTGGVRRIPDLEEDRIAAVVALAEALHCSVLLKGRHTIVVEHPVLLGKVAAAESGGTADSSDDMEDGVVTRTRVSCIDAGTSWGATPGSGDVLAGITGALMAQAAAHDGSATLAAPQAVVLHALAAAIAAETPEGCAPTSASRIAEAIPRAWARSGPSYTERWYEQVSSRT